ncbi:PBSX family phage terminase large subunit [Paractinoplanes maris]|uniref:PBSX family phage terminase large subunit n=1 Tax=Paractinoplanes maris TaxID=1734446 RepID=UPI0020205FDA|nr:PBSX family phage terminase large subunit [Actinoplanes maris]
MSPKQLDFVANSNARINVASGAVRSGKTIGSLLKWLMICADPPPGGELVVAAKTAQTAARNLFAPLTSPELFGELAQHVHYTMGAPTATILGRRVHVIGANDARSESKIRGMTVAACLMDEATLLPREFFHQMLARMSVPDATMIATTNADSSGHWLRKEFLLNGDIDLRQWHFKLDDNPHLPQAYKDALKAEYGAGSLFYKRFVDGLWILAEGAIYDMWNPDVHVVDTLPQMWRWVSAGVDYGTTNPFAALLLGVAGDQLYLASEWRYDSRKERRSLTDVEYSARLKGWLTSYQPPGSAQVGVTPEMVAVDPSAASFMQQLFRDGWSPTPADNSVLDGIRLFSSLLSANRLKVHRSCQGLIDEIPGYSWDPAKALRGIDAPIKVDDHSADAGRYAVVTSEGSWRRPTPPMTRPIRMPSDYVDLTSAAM